MTKKRDTNELSNLVAEVQYLLLHESEKGALPTDREVSRDARKVASALSFLRWVTTQHLTNMDAIAAKSAGVNEAHDFLQSLIVGSDHPLFDYVKRLRTDLPNRPKLSPSQTITWLYVVAAVHVLNTRFQISVSEARRIMAVRLKKIPMFKTVSPESIRKKEERIDSIEEKEILSALEKVLNAAEWSAASDMIEWVVIRIVYQSEPPFLGSPPDPRQFGFRHNQKHQDPK